LDSREKLKKAYQDSSNVNPQDLATTSRDENFLNKAIHLIEDHISDPGYVIEIFVQDMGMSRSMLYRKLQELTGQSPHEFISGVKFKYAAQQLLSGEYTISEVAYMVGFNDPRYFSRSFRKKFNRTPTEYIKDHEAS
jgi:AraC-like DNA-binding protein